jgi:hypothetical protein
MSLTPLARKVLEAAAGRDGVGARDVAQILGYGRKYMRAGQYAGRLRREGWLTSEMQWYRGARGHDCYSHTLYFITKKGRDAITRKP